MPTRSSTSQTSSSGRVRGRDSCSIPLSHARPAFRRRARGGVYLPCGSAFAHCRRWCGLTQARSAERDGFQVPQAHESTGRAIRKNGWRCGAAHPGARALLISSQGEPSTIVLAQQPARNRRAASGARGIGVRPAARREERAPRTPSEFLMFLLAPNASKRTCPAVRGFSSPARAKPWSRSRERTATS